jgi:hypothetical protein
MEMKKKEKKRGGECCVLSTSTCEMNIWEHRKGQPEKLSTLKANLWQWIFCLLCRFISQFPLLLTKFLPVFTLCNTTAVLYEKETAYYSRSPPQVPVKWTFGNTERGNQRNFQLWSQDKEQDKQNKNTTQKIRRARQTLRNM